METVDRCVLMEAALEGFSEGVALLDCEGRVIFWNHAAEQVTGFPGIDVVSRGSPFGLEQLLAPADCEPQAETPTHARTQRQTLVRAQHRSGQELPLMMRRTMLRDGLGERIGAAIVFHFAESLDTLPHGESCEELNVEAAQAEIEEQARSAFEEFAHHDAPLGLLWITVDQAHELRKTHGAKACQTMIERIERTLTNGLRPSEEMGRWGDDEFLVLSHEPTAERLAAHGQSLAGLARTSDFRWWGDKLSLTVSIGAALALKTETLAELFKRAQSAMLASVHAGGNHTTLAPEK
jgi:diguanylate cyclase (GGDEF)-like protein/PAS domain S-box-containing protein